MRDFPLLERITHLEGVRVIFLYYLSLLENVN